jgi:acyl carrier protein
MTRETLISLINQVFVDKFELDPADLTPEKRIFEDLELDSLDVVDLITGLQHTFGIPLRDNKELLQIRTLANIYDLFEKLVQEHPELEEKLAKKP